ncbi:MAG: Smr/MutS family protein [Planctomycetota bacterium]|nr:Smr/MutS family protein [Planctomycetota bacterium]MDG1985309.1 Smr/MutS family protein [Planctomycetota bacterium]
MASGNRNRRRRFDPDLDRRGDRGEGPEIYEVDLHGCTVQQAERRLLEELTRCRAARRSPVHVITGRGFGSKGGNGVLKPAMTRWLQGPQGQRVGVAGVREVNDGGALEVKIER